MRDLSTMYGPTLKKPEDARRYWTEFLARSGKTTMSDTRTVKAYINHSRWVADCPECNDGIACARWMPEGCCLNCGHVFAVEFPADAAAAEKELKDRPSKARNWKPHKGETVERLKNENKVRDAGTREVKQEPVAKVVVPGPIDPDEITAILTTGFIIRNNDEAKTSEIEATARKQSDLEDLLKKL